MDLQLLGSKLKRYRDQFQLGLSDVARATGLAAEALAAYEGGVKEPTGDEVLILADYYRCDYKFFLSNEKLAPFEQTETLFRRYGAQLSRADRWAIQEFLFLCECEEFLLGLLPAVRRVPFSFAKEGSYYKGHGEQAAAALRHTLGYPPNAVVPNVFDDLRRIGVHVFRRGLANSDISGLFVRHPTAGKCVLVNYEEDVYRQRFTAAHEGGHALLDDDQDVVVSFHQAGRSSLSEVRANTFASRFLLPPGLLAMMGDGYTWTPEKAVDWARRLRVSTAALAIALKEAGLIDQAGEAAIRSVKVPAGLKTDPELPESLSPRSRARKAELLRRGLSSFYVGLCFDAYDAAYISAGRLAEMLLVGPHDLGELAALYHRGLSYAG